MDESLKELAKHSLELIEELKLEHANAFNKLLVVFSDIQENLNKKYDITLPINSIILMADYFNEDKFKLIRKRILDRANDLSRKINL